jgi:hypothetical protein
MAKTVTGGVLMADRRFGRKALGLVLAVVAVGALTMPVAGAAVSAGVSANCDPDGHCVEGGATSSNVGNTDLVEAQILPNGTGAAAAVCTGTANGATLMEITCAHGRQSRTMSFPGSAGAVPLQTTQAKLDRWPVCWDVTGYFPVLLGGLQHIVNTHGCSQLAI